MFKVERLLDLHTPGSGVAVAWAPDGSQLAAASDFGSELTVWDRNGRPIKQIHREGEGPALGRSLVFVGGTSKLVFVPQGRANYDTALEVWDVATGLVSGFVIGPEPGQDYSANRTPWFDISPDQELLVAGTGGTRENVAFYRTSDWRLKKATHVEHGVFSLRLFARGRLAIVGSADGCATILDSATGRDLRRIQVYPPSPVGTVLISSVSGSPDGQYVMVGAGLTSLSGSFRGSPSDLSDWRKSIDPIRLFRSDTGTQITSFSEPETPIRQIAWDPSGNFVAIADAKSGLYLWAPNLSREHLQRVELGSRPFSIAISPAGDQIAVAGDSGVTVFQIHR